MLRLQKAQGELSAVPVFYYPLVVLSVLHAVEHIYIYGQFVRTGVTGGPGLLGRGGAFGAIPIDRFDLHNTYNGVEMVLIALGFWNESEMALSRGEGIANHFPDTSDSGAQ